MNDLAKVEMLLPHWIEHQHEHADELRIWAERIRLTGQVDVVDRLLAAADLLQQAGNELSSLLSQMGEGAESGEKI